MSRPRAATSVATSKRTTPSRNCCNASNRAGCVMSPCSAPTENPDLLSVFSTRDASILYSTNTRIRAVGGPPPFLFGASFFRWARRRPLSCVVNQRSSSRLKKIGHLLFFPFIVKYLDFWDISVRGGKSYIPHRQHTLCNTAVSCQFFASYRDPYWIAQERGGQTTHCLWPRSADYTPSQQRQCGDT